MVSIIKTTLVFFALSLLSTGEAKYLESDYYEKIREEAMEYDEYSDTPPAAMEYYKEGPSKEPELDELEQMTDKYTQQQEEDCDKITELHLHYQLHKCEINKNISKDMLPTYPNSCDTLKERLRICEKPATCKEVRAYNNITGDYTLHVNGREIEVTCVMEERCERKGPWTLRKQYQLQESASCPGVLATRRVSGVRICTKDDNSCKSVKLWAQGIKYSKVCGMVSGYQKGSTDAFRIIRATNVKGNYVDGVSITQGKDRKHIWTYAAGVSEDYPFESGCPCNKGNTRSAPSFVGNHYYCESAFRSGVIHPPKFEVSDILWDGRRLRGPEEGCDRSLMPWFYRSLGSDSEASTDYIEIRLCTNEHPSNENVGIGEYEFYTK